MTRKRGVQTTQLTLIDHATGYLLTDYFSGETLANVQTDQVSTAKIGELSDAAPLPSPPQGLKRGEKSRGCPISHLRLQAGKRSCGKDKADGASGASREQRSEKVDDAGKPQKQSRRSDASATASVKKRHNELR